MSNEIVLNTRNSKICAFAADISTGDALEGKLLQSIERLWGKNYMSGQKKRKDDKTCYARNSASIHVINTTFRNDNRWIQNLHLYFPHQFDISPQAIQRNERRGILYSEFHRNT